MNPSPAICAPTNEEFQLIKKFRHQVEDLLVDEYMQSESFLIRWIRARDHNLGKAEKMIRDSYEWRKKNDIDSILTKDFGDYFSKNYPFFVQGIDKDGRPLVIVRIGQWDIKKAADEGRIDEFVLYTSKIFETVVDGIKKSKWSQKVAHDWPVTQMTVIVDWDGFSFRQLTNMKAAQGILQMASTYEAHYPEILFKAFFINCTYVFGLMFKLMKPLLAPKTLGKIDLFGAKKEEFIPEILKLIDEETLSALPDLGVMFSEWLKNNKVQNK